MQSIALQSPATSTLKDQSRKVLTQIAGYVGVRTMAIGLRAGLFAAISKHPDGVSVQVLADESASTPST